MVTWQARGTFFQGGGFLINFYWGLDGIFGEGNLGFWRGQGGGEWREDSEAVNESFWDAPGVEIEARQVFE